MTGWLGRWLLALIAALTASACSLETAINAMSSAEDRQFAQDFVINLKAGNEAWLSSRMDPQVWIESGPGMKQVASFYPPEPSRTILVGYHISTNSIAGGGSTRRQQFVLVTEGAGRWAVTEIHRLADGGPARVVAWRVTPRQTRPPELQGYELTQQMVPWIWALLGLFALVIAGIVWAYVRYRRRKRAAASMRYAATGAP
ncbi:MAG TPA: hypothetical protein VF702_02355 [Allosphingosinicella sp.]|jgi:cbb3-type cytochrome oxidase subunit 3